ncbi:serine/threonine protein kinase [Puniceicoccales bacterium CK1056]|uniref:Serine/threonine protein kinase n=1 Tax=Oceanipulchritudo coccoides TaxID=2706888 RepID=A0A6B2M001_9BACT|nr:serine/threonine-protein kinase [Oceanipulchritudo coccoides]NDV61656.1 serine/threonine protein kinase [Oceanipulchritudo coccoides]
MKKNRKIHQGGFGAVYEATNANGEIVALKEFSPNFTIATLAEKIKLTKRFVREVRTQSQMPRELFIPIIEHDLKIDPPWYAMPLASKTLIDEISESKNNSTIPVEALADILNALEYMHERSYVHRDLKPGNVLFHDGRWKLSDFGLVLPPKGETTKLTSYDSNWGSQNYCAPEQAIAFKKVGPEADIYAFGCILHDIFGSGSRIPFQQYDAIGPVGRIIRKCTEVEPSKRFNSITNLRNNLLTLLSKTGVTTNLTANADEWLRRLKEEASWNQESIDDFVYFINKDFDLNSENPFLKEIDEDALESAKNISDEIFSALAECICNWAHGTFIFAYCDVLAMKLVKIFDLGELDTKSYAVLALAALGSSHNRWFVMERLLRITGHSLEDDIAERIAMEISIEERSHDFQACAERISRTINHYHPQIAETINSYNNS